MERDEVMKMVRDHLSTELEDRYGIRVSEEEAAEIETVGDAVDFVCARVPAAG